MNLNDLIALIREEHGAAVTHVPGIDPLNGNENATYLLLLESPGPMAVKSGQVSIKNNDATARNLGKQLTEADIQQAHIVIWNVIPWVLRSDRGTIRAARQDDFDKARPYLQYLIEALPHLKCIVLVGTAARRAHVHLSTIAKVPILSCHHTSAQSMNSDRRRAGENIAVFQFMKAAFPPFKSIHDYWEEDSSGRIRPIPPETGRRFDTWITSASEKWQRAPVVQIRRYQSKECHDGMGGFDDSDENWGNLQVRTFTYWYINRANQTEEEQLIGAVGFSKEEDGRHVMEFCWIHPFHRRKGKLREAWPEFRERFGGFIVLLPSDSMKHFLEKVKHPTDLIWSYR